MNGLLNDAVGQNVGFYKRIDAGCDYVSYEPQPPSPEWVFSVSPLEVYSPGLMRLLIELFAELEQDGSDSTPADLATWISGIATGIEYSEPAYLQCSYKSGAIADLRTLESFLIMRGRCAA